jgi:hypothetical protein
MRIFLLTLLSLLLLTTSALGCECLQMPTILDEYESVSAVIVGRPVSLKKSNGIDEYEGHNEIESVQMKVEKVFKGNLKAGDVVPFWQGGGSDCVWYFDDDDIGKEFLLYSDGPSKDPPMGAGEAKGAPMYSSSSCGRSRQLKRAIDDLAYLSNIPAHRGRSRVSGVVVDGPETADFPNLTIRIRGKSKSFSSKTNGSGFFELYDLPAGEYVLELVMPPGFAADDFYSRLRTSGFGEIKQNGRRVRIPFTLKAKKHASLYLILRKINQT